MARITIMVALLGLGLLAGCDAASTPGTTRMLGTVDYDTAFRTARTVLARHFSIENAEPLTGVITSRPKEIENRPAGLIGITQGQTRQVAHLRVQRAGGQIMARLAVAVQTLGTPGVRRQVFGTGENYDSVPNKSPAEVEGATTPDQNDEWATRRYDGRREAEILNEIYRELNPAATQPAAAPPAGPPARPAESRAAK